MVKAFKKKSRQEYIHRESSSKKIIRTNEAESNVIVSRILPLEDSLDDFVKYDSVKFRKIVKTTKLKTKIDKKSLIKAIKALKINIKSEISESQETEGEQFIFLDIKMDQIPDSYSIKPFQINLPTPIYHSQNSKFCILAKDPCNELISKVKARKRESVLKIVLGNTNFHQKFPKKQDKRKLINKYDYFLCDHRLYNSVIKSTGSVFYSKKKLPFPVNISDIPESQKQEFESHEEYLESFSKSTFFMLGNGPIYSLKVARSEMENKQIAKNILAVVYKMIPLILKSNAKHTKIAKISIRTSNSISIPFYPTQKENENDDKN